MKRVAMLAGCAVLLLLANRGAADEHTKDTLDMVKDGLKSKKAILVDVREVKEWESGHLKDAVLVPLSKLNGTEGDAAIKELPKDKVIYLHCARGSRCLKAARILKDQGYDARPLAAGYEVLLKEGFPKADK
jgi:rhodanese-related sulfurtransferase